METINLGLIGAGLIGSAHSLYLTAIQQEKVFPLRLKAAGDPDPAKLDRLAKAFHWETQTQKPMEVIEDPEVNAVFICTPTAFHQQYVEAAAAAGKAVFCEKPLAVSAAEARAMLEIVTKAGVVHQVGLVLRLGSVWNALKELARRPEAGFPITCIFRDDQCFPIKGLHDSNWRAQPELAGAGTLLEHSIHDLDIMEWMFGRVHQVLAVTASRFGHPGIEDLARVLLEFESGMTATLVSIWHDVLHRHSNRRIEVFCEKTYYAHEAEFFGTIDYMVADRALKTLSEEEVFQLSLEARGITDPVEKKLARMYGVLEDYYFCRAVRARTKAEPGFEVAVRAHELVDACYQSAREGKPIEP
jgi:predicted dehydrogenase